MFSGLLKQLELIWDV